MGLHNVQTSFRIEYSYPLSVNFVNDEAENHSQTSTIETRNEIRDALPFYDHLRRQNIIAHSKRYGVNINVG